MALAVLLVRALVAVPSSPGWKPPVFTSEPHLSVPMPPLSLLAPGAPSQRSASSRRGCPKTPGMAAARKCSPSARVWAGGKGPSHLRRVPLKV
jgi:hypothetical protein